MVLGVAAAGMAGCLGRDDVPGDAMAAAFADAEPIAALDATALDARVAMDAAALDASGPAEVGPDAGALRDAATTTTATTTDGGVSDAGDAGPVDSGSPPAFGDPCVDDDACDGVPGGFPICLNTSTFIFPGFGVDEGYCASTCRSDADCGLDGVCLESSPFPDVTVAFCVAACSAQRTCARPEHACVDRAYGLAPASRPMCLPFTATAAVGSACDTFADCRAGDVCLNHQQNWPGGMCVQVGCTIGDPTSCPAASACVRFEEFGTTRCMPSCSTTSTTSPACRAGYECTDLSSAEVCHPINVRRLAGEPCVDADSCSPGNTVWECLRSSEFPAGYCTNFCDPRLPTGLVLSAGPGACSNDEVCVASSPEYPSPGGVPYCARLCRDLPEVNCPSGHVCRTSTAGAGGLVEVCVPPP